MTALNEPLMLRHGAPLPNRIAKAAMEELLAAPGQVPGDRLIALYRRWAAGGAGRAPCPAALALLVERLVRARRRRAYETWRATR
ncbi:hypothetical protein [Streptomyces sp. AA0539]|uniref:hypothetical protein n=1 Tax=Streptomyces sp. AA0539 TaxID=1210045 RepID=UPI0002D4775C|nr:hypothetical protein [Streptomyces sp. AA0539]